MERYNIGGIVSAIQQVIELQEQIANLQTINRRLVEALKEAIRYMEEVGINAWNSDIIDDGKQALAKAKGA